MISANEKKLIKQKLRDAKKLHEQLVLDIKRASELEKKESVLTLLKWVDALNEKKKQLKRKLGA